jgi:hypothetical protein
MSTDVDRPARRSDPLLRTVTAATLLVAGVGVLLLLRFALTGDPAGHVTLTIENPTGLHLRVEAVDTAGTTLNLGTVPPESTTTVREVVDIGPSWTFVVHLADRELARIPPMSRDQLQAQGWRVRIPPGAGGPSGVAPASPVP